MPVDGASVYPVTVDVSNLGTTIFPVGADNRYAATFVADAPSDPAAFVPTDRNEVVRTTFAATPLVAETVVAEAARVSARGVVPAEACAYHGFNQTEPELIKKAAQFILSH